jgi:Protein of unknown function (DUF1604)
MFIGDRVAQLSTKSDVSTSLLTQAKEKVDRLHGAFTGGWSAGYYNTVGSKEGWKPNEYRSSRSERMKFERKTVSDFMDEEDDPLLAGSIALKSEWKAPTKNLSSNVALPSDFFSIFSNNIGQRLLTSMGWKPVHSIGLHPPSYLVELEAALEREKTLQRIDHVDISTGATKLPGIGYVSSTIPLRSHGKDGYSQSLLMDDEANKIKFALSNGEAYYDNEIPEFSSSSLNRPSTLSRSLESALEKEPKRLRLEDQSKTGYLKKQTDKKASIPPYTPPEMTALPPLPAPVTMRKTSSVPLPPDFPLRPLVETAGNMQRRPLQSNQSNPATRRTIEKLTAGFESRFTSSDKSQPLEVDKASAPSKVPETTVSRQVLHWRPAKLLSKRMNLPEVA